MNQTLRRTYPISPRIEEGMKRRMARDITRFDEDKRRSRRRFFFLFLSLTRQDTYFRDSFIDDSELFVSSRILNGQVSV